jgi:hypothetical protein
VRQASFANTGPADSRCPAAFAEWPPLGSFFWPFCLFPAAMMRPKPACPILATNGQDAGETVAIWSRRRLKKTRGSGGIVIGPSSLDCSGERRLAPPDAPRARLEARLRVLTTRSPRSDGFKPSAVRIRTQNYGPRQATGSYIPLVVASLGTDDGEWERDSLEDK